MIKIIKRGDYQLVEIKKNTKVFILDNTKAFTWVDTSAEFIEYNPRVEQQATTLSRGKYFLYEVHDEKPFSDTLHWELYLGKRTWQGYLLPDGLPSKKEKTKKIFPTEELITKTVQ